jgi:hypothetical protein
MNDFFRGYIAWLMLRTASVTGLLLLALISFW